MKLERTIFLWLIVIAVSNSAFGQSDKLNGRTFDNPVITDSTSFMLIPYRYETALFTSNKMMTWNYLANFITYDFKNDSYKKLFPKDTYILQPENDHYHYGPAKPGPHYPYISEKWIFYLVRNTDYNGNGKIDERDPLILHASDLRGEGLRSLTAEHESVVGLTLYEKQGFALLTVRRDDNNDRDFKPEDNNLYLMRLDLSDLRLGKPIEYGVEKPD